MLLKGDEVVERIDLRQAARLDDAHEDAADVGAAVQGAEEEAVFAMPDCHFQGSFHGIVIEWGPGDLEERRQGFPVLSSSSPPFLPSRGLHSPCHCLLRIF